MNWVFETYSNVYSTAMMQDTKTVRNAATAKQTSLFAAHSPASSAAPNRGPRKIGSSDCPEGLVF